MTEHKIGMPRMAKMKRISVTSTAMCPNWGSAWYRHSMISSGKSQSSGRRGTDSPSGLRTRRRRGTGHHSACQSVQRREAQVSRLFGCMHQIKCSHKSKLDLSKVIIMMSKKTSLLADCTSTLRPAMQPAIQPPIQPAQFKLLENAYL